MSTGLSVFDTVARVTNTWLGAMDDQPAPGESRELPDRLPEPPSALLPSAHTV